MSHNPRKVVVVLVMVVVVHVIVFVIVVLGLVVINVGPRNLTLKFGQNQVRY